MRVLREAPGLAMPITQKMEDKMATSKMIIRKHQARKFNRFYQRLMREVRQYEELDGDSFNPFYGPRARMMADEILSKIDLVDFDYCQEYADYWQNDGYGMYASLWSIAADYQRRKS